MEKITNLNKIIKTTSKHMGTGGNQIIWARILDNKNNHLQFKIRTIYCGKNILFEGESQCVYFFL